MIPHDPLQPLHDLDRASPQFHKQLIDFLRGNEYQDVVSGLQNESLAWLVEYLDNVSLQTIFPDHLQDVQRWSRSSAIYPIRAVPHFRNHCTNSEGYAASRRCYRNRVRFWTLS